MNAPAGFRLVDDRIVDVDPFAAMFNVATGAQMTHMIFAAYLVTGFSVASYYAVRLVKRGSEYDRRAFTLSLLLALSCLVSFIRKRTWPEAKAFLWSIVLLGPLSVIAVEAGWVVTEVRRQSWIVQGYMRTSEAVTQAPGVWNLFYLTLTIYFVIGVATIVILRQLARVPITENAHGAS